MTPGPDQNRVYMKGAAACPTATTPTQHNQHDHEREDPVDLVLPGELVELGEEAGRIPELTHDNDSAGQSSVKVSRQFSVS